MALIAVMGNSGKGKSTSIRTLDPKKTFLIQVIPKPLPFKGWRKNYPLYDKSTGKGNRYVVFDKLFHAEAGKSNKEQYYNASLRVQAAIEVAVENGFKNIVIDDSQYLMAYEFMARSRELGYEKYSQIAQNFFNIIAKASSVQDNAHVVFLHHTEVSDGITKMKTQGKMLDNHVTIEGLFTYVVLADSVKENGNVKFVFRVKDDGNTVVKTPDEMFKDELIPNDLNLLIQSINKYEEGE